jgi:hypothetical protein
VAVSVRGGMVSATVAAAMQIDEGRPKKPWRPAG